jgi:amino acid transporter
MFAAAMISVLLGLETTLMSGARLPFTMAEDGFFPHALAKLHERFRTPVRGIVLSTAICAALAVFTLPQLIAIYMWPRVFTSSLTLLSVWRLRSKAPEMPRGFRIPGGRLGITLVVMVPLALFSWMLVNGDSSALVWGPVTLALGPAGYALLRLARGK